MTGSVSGVCVCVCDTLTTDLVFNVLLDGAYFCVVEHVTEQRHTEH